MSNRLHLFQGFGIELEYMIVDRESLVTRPLTDLLFKKICGEYASDLEFGKVTWSNELVLHVVEIKCTEPEADLVNLLKEFNKNVERLNKELAHFGACLMPTAAHPLMNPKKDTFLWPHDNNEIYDAYNRIFNCKGHGWSNLQSTHINLPFYDDEEFARLHAAIRVLLPILPALSASSPILDGTDTGFLDKRLDYYQKNQKVVPALTGKVIPERAFSKRQYHKMIYDRIAFDIAPHDPYHILQPVWLNSRGAIARFDRGAIEIRILDIQECPQADLAIASAIIAVLKMLVNEEIATYHDQQSWEVAPLQEMFLQVIKTAEGTEITNSQYLSMWGMDVQQATASEVWAYLISRAKTHYPEHIEPWEEQLNIILTQGTLASRIMKSLAGVYTPENLKLIYRELCDCLSLNEMFQLWVEEKS